MKPMIPIALLVIMIAQGALSVVQVKRYQAFLAHLIARHEGAIGARLYTEVSNKGFMRTVVAVVVDARDRIVECDTCRGLTVFSRFKRESRYEGSSLTGDFGENRSGTRGGREVERLLAQICRTYRNGADRAVLETV